MNRAYPQCFPPEEFVHLRIFTQSCPFYQPNCVWLTFLGPEKKASLQMLKIAILRSRFVNRAWISNEGREFRRYQNWEDQFTGQVPNWDALVTYVNLQNSLKIVHKSWAGCILSTFHLRILTQSCPFYHPSYVWLIFLGPEKKESQQIQISSCDAPEPQHGSDIPATPPAPSRIKCLSQESHLSLTNIAACPWLCFHPP